MSGLRADLAVIARLVEPGSRVLDVGCGDGQLLAELEAQRDVDARGLELDPELVERSIARGLSVVQGDANCDLCDYPDRAFDYVILSQTLQTAQRPDQMLDELLRVGRKVFVSFPNFAHWRTRAALLLGGRMPVTRALPLSWYETQNIHHVTVRDFRDLIAAKGVCTDAVWYFSGGHEIGAAGANWRAEFALFKLSQ